MIPSRHSSKGRDARAPCLEISRVLEESRDLDGAFGHAEDVELGGRVDELAYHVLEDVADVLLGILVAGNDVLRVVEPVCVLHGALLRQRVPRRLRDGRLAAPPPPQLSHVGEDDARGVGIVGRRALCLDVLDEIDGRACVDSSFAADDAVGEDADVLRVLVEEDHDALLAFQVG